MSLTRTQSAASTLTLPITKIDAQQSTISCNLRKAHSVMPLIEWVQAAAEQSQLNNSYQRFLLPSADSDEGSYCSEHGSSVSDIMEIEDPGSCRIPKDLIRSLSQSFRWNEVSCGNYEPEAARTRPVYRVKEIESDPIPSIPSTPKSSPKSFPGTPKLRRGALQFHSVQETHSHPRWRRTTNKSIPSTSHWKLSTPKSVPGAPKTRSSIPKFSSFSGIGKDEHMNWYIHELKTGKCLLNHVELRKAMDDLRGWKAQAPGNCCLTYRHVKTGDVVTLPWPDVEAGSPDEIETFVSTVNRLEGRTVFFSRFERSPYYCAKYTAWIAPPYSSGTAATLRNFSLVSLPGPLAREPISPR